MCCANLPWGVPRDGNSEDEHYCKCSNLQWGTSSGDSIYLPWGTHMTFKNAKGEWIVEWVWQLSY